MCSWLLVCVCLVAQSTAECVADCWWVSHAGLATDFLKDYVHINIGSLDLSANHNITQIVEICQDYEKEYK